MSKREYKFQLRPDEIRPGDILAENVNILNVLELEKGRKLTISDVRQLRQSELSKLKISRRGNRYIQTQNFVSRRENLKRKAG